MFNNPSFYNDVIDQSLRCNEGDNNELTFTPSSNGDAKHFTMSAWVKKTNITTGGGTRTIVGVHRGGYADFIGFYSNDVTTISLNNTYTIGTTSTFRDAAGWYHVVWVLDADNGTAADRLKCYINGVQQTLQGQGASANTIADTNYGFSQTNQHSIGGLGSFNGYGFDGYLAEVNFLDGQVLDPTYFGETKNGIWIPKKLSGLTYGTNGFRTTFEGTGTATSSGAVSSPTNIGDDSSGNNHHFAVSGFVSSDIVPDCPENNYATWNKLFKGGEQSSSIYANSTLSEGNLTVSVPTNSYMGSTFRPTSGKWYAEIRVKTMGTTNGEIGWGWLQATTYSGNTAHAGVANKWGGYYHGYSTNHIRLYDETSQLGSNINLTISAGSILQLAWDIDNGKGWIGINNTWYRTNATDGNPSAGTNETFTFTTDEARNLQVYIANGTSTDVHTVNFGQDSTFGGLISAGGNADANGEGDFAYAPPTGFLACCSANLPDTTLSPNKGEQADDHFNTVLFNGTGSSPLSVTGVGFKPDFLWLKRRDNATNGNHLLYDSSRGGTNALRANTNGAESQFGDMVITFASDGFSFTGTDGLNNSSSYSNVAWSWKANGGTTSSNGDGSITSTVQANTKAGFSIVLWNGEGDSQATVGHGLGAVPKVIIPKNRDAAGNWHMYHVGTDASAPEDYGILLNATNARSDDSGFHNDTAPTSSVFTVGTYNNFNNNYVAYCFAEIDGYSRFGRYTGNGSTDGTFVFTGFRPAFLLYKNTSSGNWIMDDNKTQTFNPDSNYLVANSADAEGDTTTNTAGHVFDMLSNGFKFRNTNSDRNASGVVYIYMAFAEAPFKFANAR